jgi:hypothetical protein
MAFSGMPMVSVVFLLVPVYMLNSALHCGPHVQEYVTKWRAGVSRLWLAWYHLSIPEVIMSFLEHLPASVLYQVLHCQILKDIDSIQFDDIATFISVTNDVLEIDSVYRPAAPTCNPHPQPSHQPNPALLVTKEL